MKLVCVLQFFRIVQLHIEFVPQRSSFAVFWWQDAAVQSLKHLWFSAKSPLSKVSREPQRKRCLLIVFTNMLTSCLNIQTLLAHKPRDSARPPLPPRPPPIPSHPIPAPLPSADSYFNNDAANFHRVDVRARRMSRHFVKYVDTVKTHARRRKRYGKREGGWGGGWKTNII